MLKLRTVSIPRFSLPNYICLSNRFGVLRLVFLAVLRPIRMSASAFPIPREKPDFIEEEPKRNPGNNGIRNVEPRMPFAEGIQAQAIPAVNMRQTLVIRVESKLRAEYMDIGTLGQSVVDLDRIDIAEFSGLYCTAPCNSSSGTTLDLELRISGKQSAALES